MKAMIVGAAGQLGRALARTAPAHAEVACYDRESLDITDPARVTAAMSECEPDIVFNAAAYTAVDRAEAEPDAAKSINTHAVANLAEAARLTDAKLVHVSTDFVFAGDAGKPYPPSAPTAPLGMYGASKLAGESEAGRLSNTLIVRTAWVYDREGANFVNTMLRLMGERESLSVVADQVGTPTLAEDLAAALWMLAEKDALGILHYTNSGVASWYDFAIAIQEEALAAGTLLSAIPIMPIRTSDYPTDAERPSYSVLDCSETWQILGSPARHWRTALRSIFEETE